jgi:hypothetical protein
VENVDIGGPTLVRAAAKNAPSTIPVCLPSQYGELIQALRGGKGEVHDALALRFASFAWEEVYRYDQAIAEALGSGMPKKLRYGENPHQSAWFKSSGDSPIAWGSPLTSNELSYNNKKIPLTKIDRMLMGGFEFLIQYLETLDVDIIRQLPINTFYYFEFSPHTKKVYLLYMESNTQKYTLSEIQKYSKILEVNPPNIIHSGPLSDEAKKDILDIIHLGQEISTENFLQKVFGHSTSISSDVEIDNIIINFENNKTKQSYTARLASSILNGYIRFVEKNKNNITKPPINDVYAILFLDSLAFMTNAVKNFKPEEYIVNYDERYKTKGSAAENLASNSNF